MSKLISVDQLILAQQKIIQAIKLEEHQLDKIKTLDEPITSRWQQLLGFLLNIQLEIIQKFGFEGNQTGLNLFNRVLMESQSQNPALRGLNIEKWNYLLEKGFGITNVPKITLEQARNLINDIVSAATSEIFLCQIDVLVSKLDSNASMIERRQKLLDILLPLQISIMEKHGFTGEYGYVHAQKSIAEFYYDPIIMEKAEQVQSVIFRRAKLLP